MRESLLDQGTFVLAVVAVLNGPLLMMCRRGLRREMERIAVVYLGYISRPRYCIRVHACPVKSCRVVRRRGAAVPT